MIREVCDRLVGKRARQVERQDAIDAKLVDADLKRERQEDE